MRRQKLPKYMLEYIEARFAVHGYITQIARHGSWWSFGIIGASFQKAEIIKMTENLRKRVAS